MAKSLKQVELRLLSELMHNSKRSDREVAKMLGTSQATVSRTRRKLEKDGYIKEYTFIPDFIKLGYEIMAITFVKTVTRPNREELEKMKKVAQELEKAIAFNCILAISGQGLGYEGVIISFHQNYDSFLELKKQIAESGYADSRSIDSFLISLKSEFAYRPLTFATLAKHIRTLRETA